MTIEEKAIEAYPCYDCGSMEYVDCDICMIPPLREAYRKGFKDGCHNK